MTASPIARLIDQIPAAFHRLSAAGDALHAPLGLTSGMRGLLLSLEARGPTTVSRLAAMRPVSRQFVQRLIDSLAADGWVALQANPAHRRSPLVVLTDKGRNAVGTMRAAEAPQLAQLGAALDASDVAAASRVLTALVAHLSREQAGD